MYIFLLLLLLSLGGSLGNDNGTVQSYTLTPVDEGMSPLYKITEYFVSLILPPPPSTDILVAVIDRGIQIFDGTEFIDDIKQNLRWYLKWWINNQPGFFLCICFAILFVVLMPVIGLFFCFFRFCGHCGGRTDQLERKRDRCCRNSCAVVLLFITSLMFAVTICAFMTNERIREQTSRTSKSFSVVEKLKLSVDGVKAYKDKLIDDIKVNVMGKLSDTLENSLNQLDKLPKSARSRIDIEFKIEVTLKNLDILHGNIYKLNELYSMLGVLKDRLANDVKFYNNDVNDTNLTLQVHCNSSVSAQCTSLRNLMSSLIMPDDVLKINFPIYEPILNINNSIGDVKGNYEDILNSVNITVYDRIQEFKREGENVLEKIKYQQNEFIDQINDSVNFDVWKKNIDSKSSDVELYGSYFWYAGIGIASFMLLIELFFYMGLMFGICGQPAHEDAGSCNRGVGANLLLSGIFFLFLLSWIVMIICTCLFIVGANIHHKLCDVRTDYSPVPVASFISNLTDDYNDFGINIGMPNTSLIDIVKKCEKDDGIVEMLNFEEVRNFSDYFQIEHKFEMLKSANFLGSKSIDLSEAPLFVDNLRKNLADLSSLKISKMYSSLNELDLDRNFTAILRNFSSLSDGLDFKDDLLKGVNAIDTSAKNAVNSLRKLRNKLKEIEKIVNDTADGNSTSALLLRLDHLSNDTIEQGPQIMMKFINETANGIYKDFSQAFEVITSFITDDLGNCRPLFHVAKNVLTLVCRGIVQPLNGFWFSVGLHLFLMIPGFVLAAHLSSLYRRDCSDYQDNKSFDDPNFDAYTGVYPGDHIPLEDNRAPPY